MPKKEIKFTVNLDENNLPESIKWEATDAGFSGQKDCASMMIHLWDAEAKNSMYIDLWTKKMLVNHMDAHMFQNLMNMSETYYRATNNKEGAAKIRAFAQDFSASLKKK